MHRRSGYLLRGMFERIAFNRTPVVRGLPDIFPCWSIVHCRGDAGTLRSTSPFTPAQCVRTTDRPC